MILRFCSGSSTPSSRDRKRDEASTTVRFTPRSLFSISLTWAASLRRRTPLSTMMAWNLYDERMKTRETKETIPGTYLSPMASCINFAATVLSTPPLTAPMTRPLGPQISRMRAISFPMNSSYSSSKIRIRVPNRKKYERLNTIVQLVLHPQMFKTNRPITSFPRGE